MPRSIHIHPVQHRLCTLTFLAPGSLVIRSAGLRELEDNATARQPSVDLGVSVQSVVDATPLLLVQDHLERSAAVLLGAETLADDLDGVDQVGEDGIVDGGEGARARALLLLGVAGSARPLGPGQDAALGQDQDMAVRELLLQLAGEAVASISYTTISV